MDSIVTQARPEADERFEDVIRDDDSAVAVSVSLLYNELEMGDFSREEVRLRYRHGQQALMLEQNTRAGLLLLCGQLAYFQGDFMAAGDLLEHCVSMSRQLQLAPGVARALVRLSDVDRASGECRMEGRSSGLLSKRRTSAENSFRNTGSSDPGS